ncbi:MAG: sigma 54-interacting transcriptional regulator [Desulfobacteraceae bacterium]|nr:sigma 54-interacting transcriptional regulator [Desulfobacteraceae bacterium]
MRKAHTIYINRERFRMGLKGLEQMGVNFVSDPSKANVGAILFFPEAGEPESEPVENTLGRLRTRDIPVFVLDGVFDPAHSRTLWLDRNVAGYLVSGDRRTWTEIEEFFRRRIRAIRAAAETDNADLLEVGWSVRISEEEFKNYNFVSLFIGSMREFMVKLKKMLDLSKPRDLAPNPLNGNHGLAVLMELIWALRSRRDKHTCTANGTTYSKAQIRAVLEEGCEHSALGLLSEGCPALTQGHVLIQGETGTGKSIIANFIHEYLYEEARLSGQGDRVGMLQKVTCTNLGEKILENVLFGSIYGSFSDGITQPGAISMAYNGTLFLDEIGDLPLGMQAKLLQYLDERTIYPTGWLGKPIHIPAVVVAATNRDLRKSVEEGTFRLDLFHRFGHIVTIPPLRERLEDMERLVDFVLQNPRINPLRKSRNKSSRVVTKIERGAVERLKKYSFPGNFRELEAILRNGVLMAGDQGVDLIAERCIADIMAGPRPDRKVGKRAAGIAPSRKPAARFRAGNGRFVPGEHGSRPG